MYKATGVDDKSEFACEGQKLGQRSMSAKREKCTTVKNNIFFKCKPISFQAKFCMFIFINHENTEKISFITKCSFVDFKMGSSSSSTTTRAFLQTVFLYFILSNNKKIFKL